MNTSNSSNLIVTSYLPHSNVQNDISFHTNIILQKLIDSESSDSINDEITDKIIISEEISSRQDLSEIIDNTQDDNGINSFNREEKEDVTYSHYINEINHLSMNDENIISINIMHHFYHQITLNIYLLD